MELTNRGLVEHAKSWLGRPYWYGAKCQPCTEALLQSKRRQYPEHYADSRMATYRKHIAAGLLATDCSGLIQGYVEALQTNANGMYRRADGKGGMRTLPEVEGLLLWKDGHIGIYIGGGWGIEARGFRYGVVKTRVDQRGWTNWCYCPLIQYQDVGSTAPASCALGERTLRRGDQGEDVKALQQLLADVRYVVAVDGIFGQETENAVKIFQQSSQLEVDGIAGPMTISALLSVDDDSTEDDAAHSGAIQLRITGGSAYIRTGPGTQYAKVAVAQEGEVLATVSTEGWVPVLINGELRWISAKYVAGL